MDDRQQDKPLLFFGDIHSLSGEVRKTSKLTVTINGRQYTVSPPVKAEIERLQQLAKAWEDDARKYAGRLKELMKGTR